MEIKADTVKKLRDITGAGMMDCKKALIQANGDTAAAEKILKEMGLAAVAKRSDRATDNGRVFILVEGDKAVMLELSCETDFVARNEDFVKLGQDMCKTIIAKGYTEPNDELKAMVDALISVIKENMHLKKFVLVNVPANTLMSSYIHGEGSVGVMVELSSDKAEALAEPAVVEFAHDCALHIAAFSPLFLSAETVDAAYTAEQTEIYRAQVAAMDKPAKVLDGIVAGKVKKLYSEICFLQQPFVKDDKMSVEAKMAEIGKSVGAKLSIPAYYMYRAGV